MTTHNTSSDVPASMSDIVEKQLLPAIKDGDVDMVKSLLDTYNKLDCESRRVHIIFNKCYLSYVSDKCEILIHTAVELKRKEIVELLVKYWDNICEVLGRPNKTPLMIAAQKNQQELVEILLNHGANVNIVIEEVIDEFDNEIDQKTDSALIFATEGRNENIVKILLNHSAFVLMYDVCETWKQIFRDLIDNGPRSMMDLLMNFGPESKRVTEYIFFLAINERKLNLIEELLERGFDIEAKDRYESTPLMVTITNNNLQIAQILLDHGANVNSVTDHGSSALHCAVVNNNFSLVRFLHKNGANLNITTSGYQSPLKSAVYHRQAKMLSFLLECGAQIDIDSIDVILNLDVRLREIHPSLQKYFMTEIVQTLLIYVVEWQAENNFITKLDSKAILGNVTLKSCYEKCKKERERVKEKGFSSTTFSLYDIFKSSTLDQMASFARVEEIGNYLKKTEKFKKDFPIYADFILTKFKRGVERKFLLQRVCNFFRSLSTKNELPNLTILSTNRIFDLLDNDDLINLRCAYYS